MSAVQFGVVLIFNLCIGLMTPPVGSVLFVACGISKISIERVAKMLIPYLVALIVLLLLITFVPQISLFLPSVLGLL